MRTGISLREEGSSIVPRRDIGNVSVLDSRDFMSNARAGVVENRI